MSLNVAFIWHMHQPYYKDRQNNAYVMPWVRTHGLKDYYDMPTLIERYPRIRQTFNLVPSLLEQIEDYSENPVSDRYMDVSMKPASALSIFEKLFILRRFCDSLWRKRVGVFPRYLELLQKKERLFGISPWVAVDQFTETEYRDLQVWFNLSWFDPGIISAKRELQSLVKKGSAFSEEDKSIIAAMQTDILRRIIPLYRRLQDEGKIEITTSPYYHPILPLLCGLETAQIALPETELPEHKFCHPEDAKMQLWLAMGSYEKHFGRKPRGLWPPEEAVGEVVAPLIGETGIEWVVSDEGVLARSLKVDLENMDSRERAHMLYRPYSVERGEHAFSMVFRDRTLSDLVSFSYSSWNAVDAAKDLHGRLRAISDLLGGHAGNHLVTIALDGENCWEYYENDGKDFLHQLYCRLEADHDLKPVTVSEYLAERPESRSLDWLHTGSWIGGDLRTWIGGAAHTRAWQYLGEARKLLKDRESPDSWLQEDEEALAQAWHEIYLAEGSDWFWWFSGFHHTELIGLWDSQFRIHLRTIYRLLGIKPPHYLFRPLFEELPLVPVLEPLGPISPQMNGQPSDRNDWFLSGRYDFSPSLHTLTWTEKLLDRIYFGCDDKALYLRLETPVTLADLRDAGFFVVVGICNPAQEEANADSGVIEIFTETGELGIPMTHRLITDLTADGPARLFRALGNEEWEEGEPVSRSVAPRFIEIAIPLSRLGAHASDRLEFVLLLVKEDLGVDRAPRTGSFFVTIPASVKEEVK